MNDWYELAVELRSADIPALVVTFLGMLYGVLEIVVLSVLHVLLFINYYIYQPIKLVLDLATSLGCNIELTQLAWLHTEVVYPPEDGHPSQY